MKITPLFGSKKNKVTFVFERKGEFTNKRGKLPLKKQSLRKWPLYDCNRGVDSNFIQHPQSIPCSFLLYEQSVALDKKQTLYFAAGSIVGAETVCIISNMESFLRCLCCGGITSCPAWQGSDSGANKQTTEEEKSFPSWPNQTHASKTLSRPVDWRWVWRNHTGLMERHHVALQHLVPLNWSRRRVTPVLFTAGRHLVFFHLIPNILAWGAWGELMAANQA